MNNLPRQSIEIRFSSEHLSSGSCIDQEENFSDAMRETNIVSNQSRPLRKRPKIIASSRIKVEDEKESIDESISLNTSSINIEPETKNVRNVEWFEFMPEKVNRFEEQLPRIHLDFNFNTNSNNFDPIHFMSLHAI